MDVANNCYRRCDMDYVAFFHQELFRLGAYCFDNGLGQQFLLVQPFNAFVEIDGRYADEVSVYKLGFQEACPHLEGPASLGGLADRSAYEVRLEMGQPSGGCIRGPRCRPRSVVASAVRDLVIILIPFVVFLVPETLSLCVSLCLWNPKDPQQGGCCVI